MELKDKTMQELISKATGMQFVTIEFDCPIHGHQTFEVPSFSELVKKPCCLECKKLQRAKENRLEEAKTDSRIREHEIASLLHPVTVSNSDKFTFDTYEPETKEAVKALAIVRKFAEDFSKRESERVEAFNDQNPERYKKNAIGLYLQGKSGTGKTHLAYSIVNELHKQGFGCAYMTAIELMNGQATLFRYEEKQRALTLLTAIPVLIIDEIGRQRTDKDQSFLWSVINDRIRIGRPIVYITNCDKDEIKSVFDDSILGRLGESVYPIVCTWESRRPKMSQSNPLEIF